MMKTYFKLILEKRIVKDLIQKMRNTHFKIDILEHKDIFVFKLMILIGTIPLILS